MKKPLVLTHNDVEELMVCAMEGGSNYWYNLQANAVKTIKDHTPDMDGHPLVSRMIQAIDKGAEIQIHDIEDDDELLGTLNSESWFNAEAIMLSSTSGYRRFMADILADNMDAETGDVFFQLALFGEIVYG